MEQLNDHTWNSILAILCPVFALLVLPTCSKPQEASEAERVIVQSIQYHDPDQLWHQSEIELKLIEERPGSPPRYTNLTFDNLHDKFILQQRRGKDHVIRMVSPDTCVHRLNHSEQFSPESAEVFKLSCAHSRLLRDYYSFLWGLPMQLARTKGSIFPGVDTLLFDRLVCLRIRIEYSPPVGEDTWDFYFSKSDFTLKGYKFFHGNDTLDGEFVILSDIREISGIRFPANRSWFDLVDSTLVGTDKLIQ